MADQIEKGEPAAPPNAGAVAGSYYSGDGFGWNVMLDLKEDGTYSAELYGCHGRYGDASGSWELTGERIALTPKEEKDMLEDYLKALDVLKYKGDWILVRADKRESYDNRGVSRFTCFQKTDQIQW